MYKQFNQAKKLYDYKEKYDNLLDLSEYPKYGLVDNYGNEIFIKKNKLVYSSRYKLLLLKSALEQLEQMMDYLTELKNKSLINTYRSFLDNIKPNLGYVDDNLHEATRLQTSLSQFRAYVKFKNISWQDFYQFTDIFFEMLRGTPTTAQAFTPSVARDAGRPVLSSGLAVSLQPAQSVGLLKIYEDKNFKIFHDAAKYFGFFLNLTQPTQLILNLNSSALSISLDSFFTEQYNRSIETELERCFYFLVTLYNILYEENKYYIQHKFTECETKNLISFKQNVPSKKEVDLIKLYLDYKKSEYKLDLKQSDYKKILDVVYSLPELEAVEYINNVTRTYNKV